MESLDTILGRQLMAMCNISPAVPCTNSRFSNRTTQLVLSANAREQCQYCSCSSKPCDDVSFSGESVTKLTICSDYLLGYC